jgi:hypothetical protein
MCKVADAAKHAHEVTLTLRPMRVGAKDQVARGAPFEIQEGPIAQIRLRTLSESQMVALEDFVASASRLRGARAIVVDLRGNEGGSDAFVRDWFTTLTAGPLRYDVMDELDSEVSTQGRANRWRCQLENPKLDAEARTNIQEELGAMLHDLEEHARDGQPYRSSRRSQPAFQGSAAAIYTQPMVVLVDRSCASSCESFLLFARQLPGALLVGENSAGVGEFGEVSHYWLPHSRTAGSCSRQGTNGSTPHLGSRRRERARGSCPTCGSTARTPWQRRWPSRRVRRANRARRGCGGAPTMGPQHARDREIRPG